MKYYLLYCEAVNHPDCKIINDICHQQIPEGNLIGSIYISGEAIGAFQIGDNLGGNNSGTGEINFKTVIVIPLCENTSFCIHS